jgi:hypothetical protein
MTKTKRITVKKVTLKNNCPECFGKGGLCLTFKQDFIETKFYKSVTDTISYDMYCHICNSPIYPERWTEDIERGVAYQEKAFTPKPRTKRFKPLFWAILISSGVGSIAVITTVLITR